MEFIENHNLVEYGDHGKNIFSGGINAKKIINNNIFNINPNPLEMHERFENLYVPVGLQVTRENKNKYFSDITGGTYNNEKYDKFLNLMKGKISKNSLNKTKKKNQKKQKK